MRHGDDLRPYAPPPPAVKLLARLTARRRDLVKMIAQKTCRRQQALCPEEEASCGRMLDALRAEERRLGQHVAELLHHDENLRRKREIIQSVPGIGPVAAATLVAELSEIGQEKRTKPGKAHQDCRPGRRRPAI